jgi:diguanylate cyclase (GGDEF)-like protein
MLTIALLVLVGFLSSLNLWAEDHAAKDYIEAQDLAGEIVLLDEVLTMSARMAAATGNAEWINRHETNVGFLDDALAQAAELGDAGLFELAGLAAINDANAVLLSLEDEAFDLVLDGRSDLATRRLDAAEYEQAKSAYTAGITMLSDDIAQGVSAGVASDEASRVLAAVLSLLAIGAAIAIWFGVWRSMTAWQRRADVTERARVAGVQSRHRELRRSQRVLASLSENSPIDWWTVDRTGTFTARGGQDAETFDAVAEVASVPTVDNATPAGLTFFDVMAGKPEALEGMQKALSGSPFNRRLQIGKKTVQSVFLPIMVDGAVSEVVGISTDVSVETDLAQELQHQAEHDSLTGLLNRTGFARQVDARLATDGENATMVMLDLSGLRELNDLRGHEIGDHALTVVARRIEAVVGPDALTARVGGDEFCVFEQGLDSVGAGQLAAGLIDTIAAPIAAPDGELTLTAFAGIDGPPLSGSTFKQVLPSRLMRHAVAVATRLHDSLHR